jgi:hypothetical protein
MQEVWSSIEQRLLPIGVSGFSSDLLRTCITGRVQADAGSGEQGGRQCRAVAPRQSALADAGAVGASGQPVKFTGRELTSCAITGDAASFAP